MIHACLPDHLLGSRISQKCVEQMQVFFFVFNHQSSIFLTDLKLLLANAICCSTLTVTHKLNMLHQRKRRRKKHPVYSSAVLNESKQTVFLFVQSHEPAIKHLNCQ